MLSILLIGLSLSMDAAAVSAANGITLRPFRFRYALWMGLYFGFFQFLMPLLGSALGAAVSRRAAAVGPYLSFFLLSFIGGKMCLDALGNAPPELAPELSPETGTGALSHPRLLALAVATSIDALAAGVSFAFMEGLALLPACALIGCTTFTLSVAAALLGSRLPLLSGGRAGLLGGAVLLGIGFRLLLEAAA